MRMLFPGGSRGARVIGYLCFFFALGMLTDKEAEEIERKRREGVNGGPIVLAWVDRLLADRKERIRQLQYVRQRLNQAFRYLDEGRPSTARAQIINPVMTNCAGDPRASPRYSEPRERDCSADAIVAALSGRPADKSWT